MALSFFVLHVDTTFMFSAHQYEVNSDDEFGTGEKGGRRDESSSRTAGNENIDESRLPGRHALGKRFGALASSE
jgi:hypothetical protein